MFARLAEASMSLDVGTLFVIAICVASLLGLFLLFAWMQDRVTALAWWGGAYLIGGASGLMWRLGDLVSPPMPSNIVNVLLFFAVGMIWSAARLFHGRPVLWGAMCLGAAVWLASCLSPQFLESAASRLVVSSLIVATYTFLTAAELWRERRQSVLRRWPALLVPMLHGAIFLFPVALAGLSDPTGGILSLSTGWVAVYAIEILLYVVGAAFVVLVLAKDRTVRQYKIAAATDPLTEVLNRRGLFEAGCEIMRTRQARNEPVCALVFDLDFFKSINDRFGHATGDATLRLFGSVLKSTLRGGDAIGRLGGEEFVALLPSTLTDAASAAERVRKAFAAASAVPGKHAAATVSVGVACGSAFANIDMLIARADAALYCAKRDGRDRVEAAGEAVGRPPEQRGDREPHEDFAIAAVPLRTLAVPLVAPDAIRGWKPVFRKVHAPSMPERQLIQYETIAAPERKGAAKATPSKSALRLQCQGEFSHDA